MCDFNNFAFIDNSNINEIADDCLTQESSHLDFLFNDKVSADINVLVI